MQLAEFIRYLIEQACRVYIVDTSIDWVWVN